jgi:hypothetical protein
LNRRGFLGSVLALGVAPAVVRASDGAPTRRSDGWLHVTFPRVDGGTYLYLDGVSEVRITRGVARHRALPGYRG